MACSRPRASRREFLKAAAGLSALVAGKSTTAGASTADAAQAPPLRPTPSCPGAAPPTERQTEGPYFKPDSPLRASLVEPGMTGTRIVVTGMVLSTNCQPIARALIDVWHADDRGGYDNAGYRLRGHQSAVPTVHGLHEILSWPERKINFQVAGYAARSEVLPPTYRVRPLQLACSQAQIISALSLAVAQMGLQ